MSIIREGIKVTLLAQKNWSNIKGMIICGFDAASTAHVVPLPPSNETYKTHKHVFTVYIHTSSANDLS